MTTLERAQRRLCVDILDCVNDERGPRALDKLAVMVISGVDVMDALEHVFAEPVDHDWDELGEAGA